MSKDMRKVPTPIVVGIIPVLVKGQDLKFLSVVKDIPPLASALAFPYTTLYCDETPGQAIKSEVEKVSGLILEEDKFMPFSPPVMQGNDLILFYVYSVVFDKTIMSQVKEGSNVRLCGKNDIMAFSFHQDALSLAATQLQYIKL